MKSMNLIILSLLTLSLGCNKEDENHCDAIEMTICAEAIDRMSSQTFIGTIFLCNAQPPDMDFLDATATITAASFNSMSIHLVSDSSLIDTTLTYTISCEVVECDIPLVYIKDASGTEKGQYNQTPDRISFAFGYPNCINNTHFEGLSN